MARKVLGQAAPAATTNTDLYTVPSSHETTVSSVLVCNRGDAPGTFRVAVRPAGASLADEHYQYYDLPILANDTFVSTIGITLAATDVVMVYADTADFSFSLYGSEVEV